MYCLLWFYPLLLSRLLLRNAALTSGPHRHIPSGPFIYSFISNSFINYVLSAYCGPDPVPGTGNTALNKIDYLPSESPLAIVGGVGWKQEKNNVNRQIHSMLMMTRALEKGGRRLVEVSSANLYPTTPSSQAAGDIAQSPSALSSHRVRWDHMTHSDQWHVSLPILSLWGLNRGWCPGCLRSLPLRL